MNTWQYDGVPFAEARSHPWSDATRCADFRYYDLKRTPGHIRTSLEDFTPWSHYAAVDGFYAMLEWLNAPGALLESNDCAFAAPSANEVPSYPKRLQCSGRLMILFRTLEKNCVPSSVQGLENALHVQLGAMDESFKWGAVGITVCPARFLALPLRAQMGHQLMLSFWAWGDSEQEVMKNLARVVKNLSAALRAVSGAVTVGTP